MSLFSFKIWDKKSMHIFEDGELVQVEHPTDTDWHKRTCVLETDQLRITSWQETEIFAGESKSKTCAQVFLTDGDYVYAAYTLQAWEKLYTDEYLPKVPKSLSDIVEDLKGSEDPE